jgi:ferredoxin
MAGLARPTGRTAPAWVQYRPEITFRSREFPMPTITFTSEKKEIQVPAGANLRKEALRAGVSLYPGVHRFLNCHGLGQCGSCRVLITKGMENTSKKGLLESARLAVSLAAIGKEDTMRLACQTKVNGDITVETKPSMNLYGENFFS